MKANNAIVAATGSVLAVLSFASTVSALKQLQQLLAPFAIGHFYTDSWGAYLRLLDSQQHTVGKANTQLIERKHLTLRTRIKRLARKTICFSKSTWLHDIVIGLFINRYEFGRAI